MKRLIGGEAQVKCNHNIHILVRKGQVVGVVEINPVYGLPDIWYRQEEDYKVEYLDEHAEVGE
jgi:hypothetical protein